MIDEELVDDLRERGLGLDTRPWAVQHPALAAGRLSEPEPEPEPEPVPASVQPAEPAAMAEGDVIIDAAGFLPEDIPTTPSNGKKRVDVVGEANVLGFRIPQGLFHEAPNGPCASPPCFV